MSRQNNTNNINKIKPPLRQQERSLRHIRRYTLYFGR
nr:MAG TPA: hypothetical protein [Caudoviricetes sp.]